MSFTIQATDGEARAGVLHTAHGELRTPAFMPVGTKATVKMVDPEELRDLGAEIVLANTYHLHFRPGEDVIAELGGLHDFMAWDGPILTDSGGYQVFSLRDTIVAVDDEGVTFRSVYDGQEARFTPETVAAIQAKLGSDIAMCLDVCAPAGGPRPELAEAVRLTTLWAARQRKRYFMGIGDPEGVLEVIERGVDMFDCVLPTRMGRTGTALTSTGRLNLKNARFARDPRPLDERCDCPACSRFSRAYLRHLVNQQELLGLRLLTLHNLRFLLELTAGARAAVEAGKLASFKAETLDRMKGVSEEAAWIRR